MIRVALWLLVPWSAFVAACSGTVLADSGNMHNTYREYRHRHHHQQQQLQQQLLPLMSVSSGKQETWQQQAQLLVLHDNTVSTSSRRKRRLLSSSSTQDEGDHIINNYYSQPTTTQHKSMSSHLKNRWDFYREKKPLFSDPSTIVNDDSSNDDDDDEDTNTENSTDCDMRYGKGRLGFLACFDNDDQGKMGQHQMGMMMMMGKTIKKDMTASSKGRKGKGKGQQYPPPVTIVPNRVPTATPTTSTRLPSTSPTFTRHPSVSPTYTRSPSMPPTTTTESPQTPRPTTFSPSNINNYTQIPSTLVVSPSVPPITNNPSKEPTSLKSSTAPTRPQPETISPSISTTTLEPTEFNNSSLLSDIPSTSPTDVDAIEIPTTRPTLETPSILPSTIMNNSTVSFVRQATPFTVVYVGVRGSNSSSNNTTTAVVVPPNDFVVVQNLTQQFITDYFNEQFAGNNETRLETVTLDILVESVMMTIPPNVTYSLSIQFDNSSSFVPTTDEVNILVESAFLEPTISLLISMVQALPDDNPFSNVTRIEYVPRLDLLVNDKGGNKNTTTAITPPPVVIHDDEIPPTLSPTPTSVVISDSPSSSSNATNQTEAPVGVAPPNETLSPMNLGISDGNVLQRYKDSKLKISPFTITYNYDRNEQDVSIVDSDEAANVTLTFLNEYLRSMFDSIEPGSYASMVGVSVLDMTDTRRISYLASVHVFSNFTFNILQSELGLLVDIAFDPPVSAALLSSLSALPAENPFSRSTSVAYALREPLDGTEERSNTTKSNITRAMIAISVFVVAIVASIGLLKVQRWRKQITRKRDTAQHQIFSQNIYGDLIGFISDGTSCSGASSVNVYFEDEEIEIEFLTERSPTLRDRKVYDPLFR